MSLVSMSGAEPSLVLHQKEQKEMLSVLPDGRVRINSSSLSVLQECMRKARYSLVEGWSSAEESPATLFGSAVHAALELFYSTPIEERGKIPSLEELQLIGYGNNPEDDRLISRAIRRFTEKAEPLRPLPEEDKRSIQNGIWILHEYFKTYIDDPYVAYVDEKGPFIERDFSLDLTPKIQIFGRIDFVFRHSVTGELLPGDHKTSSALSFNGSSYFDRDKPNHQYTMYMMGANRVFGLPVENFLVNVVEVKAKPKTPRGKGVSFPRQITKRTEEDFLELTIALEDSVDRFLRARESGIWPQGGVEACNRYSGCQFKQVCASPFSLRETLLRNKFTKKETL